MFCNIDTGLMIQNLSIKLEPRLRSLFITWQLDDRYLYLMKSGALFFGMIGIGDCSVSPVIDWTLYPLSMQVAGFIFMSIGIERKMYNF